MTYPLVIIPEQTITLRDGVIAEANQKYADISRFKKLSKVKEYLDNNEGKFAVQLVIDDLKMDITEMHQNGYDYNILFINQHTASLKTTNRVAQVDIRYRTDGSVSYAEVYPNGVTPTFPESRTISLTAIPLDMEYPLPDIPVPDGMMLSPVLDHERFVLSYLGNSGTNTAVYSSNNVYSGTTEIEENTDLYIVVDEEEPLEGKVNHVAGNDYSNFDFGEVVYISGTGSSMYEKYIEFFDDITLGLMCRYGESYTRETFPEQNPQYLTRVVSVYAVVPTPPLPPDPMDDAKWSKNRIVDHVDNSNAGELKDIIKIKKGEVTGHNVSELLQDLQSCINNGSTPSPEPEPEPEPGPTLAYIIPSQIVTFDRIYARDNLAGMSSDYDYDNFGSYSSDTESDDVYILTIDGEDIETHVMLNERNGSLMFFSVDSSMVISLGTDENEGLIICNGSFNPEANSEHTLCLVRVIPAPGPEPEKIWILPLQDVDFNMTRFDMPCGYCTDLNSEYLENDESINWDSFDSTGTKYYWVVDDDPVQYYYACKYDRASGWGFGNDNDGTAFRVEPSGGAVYLGANYEPGFTGVHSVGCYVVIEPEPEPEKQELPEPTESDEGNVLKVIGGTWKAYNMLKGCNPIIKDKVYTFEYSGNNDGDYYAETGFGDYDGLSSLPIYFDPNSEPDKSSYFTVRIKLPYFDYPDEYLFKPVYDDVENVIYDFDGNAPITFLLPEVIDGNPVISMHGSYASDYGFQGGEAEVFAYQEYSVFPAPIALQDNIREENNAIIHSLYSTNGSDGSAGNVFKSLEEGIPVGVSLIDYDPNISPAIQTHVPGQILSCIQVGEGYNMTVGYWTENNNTWQINTLLFTANRGYKNFETPNNVS